MPRLLFPAPTPAACDQPALVALLGRIRVGDAEALGCFYDQTVGQVHALALRILRNPMDAEEVVVDVYLQVWERSAGYCPERGAVLAWLQTLAWSRALDLRRKSRRAPVPGVHPIEAMLAYTPCETPGPDHLTESHLLAGRVRRAMAGLSEPQRKVLALGFQQDLSHAEIAERLGLPLGTVKSHARRGLALLRAALADEDGKP